MTTLAGVPGTYRSDSGPSHDGRFVDGPYNGKTFDLKVGADIRIPRVWSDPPDLLIVANVEDGVLTSTVIPRRAIQRIGRGGLIVRFRARLK